MSTQIEENNFEKIYRETYNSVLKFITIKCNKIEDINDILQDTYIELLKILKRKGYLQLENIESYIFGISNNIIKRHYNKKNTIIKYEFKDDEDIEVKDEFDLEQDFITKENVQVIWNYIKSKDLITSKIFYLYFSLDMKISDISKELNINESSVKNKIYRTLKQAKEYLGKDV